MNIEIEYPLLLSLFMFSAGVAGFLFRRNVIVVFMCIELMLNAVNLAFITFANMHQNIEGQVMAMFVMTVAAAEAAVGLALVIASFRNKETTIVSEINILKD